MNDTDLRTRLQTGVDDIQPSDDLLGRIRHGGARRLRRRRFMSLSVAAATVVVTGGIGVVSVEAITRSRADERAAAAAGPAQGDSYRFLWGQPTKGDLAGDRQYLDQVLTAWRTSHHKSANESRGVFDYLRGEPAVYWAGNTPAGRAAVVVQQAYLRHHDDIQLDDEGIYTLVGWVGEGKDGKPTVLSDSYSAPGGSLEIGAVVGAGEDKAVVVVDPAAKAGLSTERSYPANSGSRRVYQQLTFSQGVSIVPLKRGTKVAGIRVNTFPAKASSAWTLAGTHYTLETGNEPDSRLWSDFQENEQTVWPMAPGAKATGDPVEEFRTLLAADSDPDHDATFYSMWVGHGTTADGSRLLIGEQGLDADPTHVYAILRPKQGKAVIASGGVPDRNATLPVRIKLPRNQGWAVANRNADLSYRLPGKADNWSVPTKHALLVPASATEVRVTRNGTTETVTLR